MKLFYADHFVLPLPAGHRFPMEKYGRLRCALQQLEEFRPEDFCVPPAASDEELAHAHDPAYIRRVAEGSLDARELRQLGFPWTPEMVERSRRSAGATLAACRAALREGCAANLAGGTHHAHRDHASGFCVFNDAAVAAQVLLAEGVVERIAVIDCDVHQGDGTARILADNAAAYTFSMHGARNFPFDKARSTLDVELPDGCGDDAYLTALDGALPRVLDGFAPQLVIYLAGADPYEGDRLGRLALSQTGLQQRDEAVLGACAARGIPAGVAMAGGYARNIDGTVAIHTATLRTAARIYFPPPRPRHE